MYDVASIIGKLTAEQQVVLKREFFPAREALAGALADQISSHELGGLGDNYNVAAQETLHQLESTIDKRSYMGASLTDCVEQQLPDILKGIDWLITMYGLHYDSEEAKLRQDYFLCIFPIVDRVVLEKITQPVVLINQG